jgi:uncharacterized membrane protein
MTPPPVPVHGPLAQDDEQLKLLRVFHFILAGITGLMALIPLIHVGLGLFLAFTPMEDSKGNGPPMPGVMLFMGGMMALIGLVLVCLGMALAWATYQSGQYIGQRRRRMFSIVVAALQCAAFPLGTALGVFTLVVLNRDSIRRFAYGEQV